MSFDADFLFSRLPAFYQSRDAEQGGSLRALLTVIAAQGAVLDDDIARLYENWFIETCDESLVPYIGDLLGVRGLYSVAGTPAFGQRALVANTLRLRRRKGTLSVLEELAFNASGWPARAVEFFQLLATTQHVNHTRTANVRTPDLRHALAMERIDGAFDRAAHTAELRALPGGRYNIANVGLYLWRLSAFALQGRGSAPAEAAHAGRFRFDPLGRDMALFNRPRAEDSVGHLAEPVNVPEPISRRLLHDELNALRQALVDDTDPPLGYFDADGGAVLRIWLDGEAVPPENMLVCNLSARSDDAAPHDWRRPPAQLTVAARVAGRPELDFPRDPARMLVGIDPVLGRIALPAGKVAAKVEVAYAVGFPGDIGGGPYDRRGARRADEDGSGLLAGRGFDVALRVGAGAGALPTLAAALALVVAGKRTLIELDTDASEAIFPMLVLPESYLVIEARNRRRPVLIGDIHLQGNGTTRFGLSGITLDGQLLLDGPLREVDLRHCGLTPARGGIAHTGSAPELQLVLSHCVCGPVRAQNALGSVAAGDSVVASFDLPRSALRIERCTVPGTTAAGEMAAGNSLFGARVSIERTQQGCVRFCYVPQSSQTPRRHRCQPDMVVKDLAPALAAAEAVRVRPSFTQVGYADPAYFQLTSGTASEIRRGADDGAEMGVWNMLKQAQREANITQALDEYLRFGLEAGVIFVN